MHAVSLLRRDAQRLDLRGFRWLPVSPPVGTYASWVWRGHPFPGSRTEAAIDRVVAASEGREQAIVDALLTALGIPGQPLGASPFTLTLETPGGGIAVLSGTWDKGLRLHFPVETPRAVMEAAWDAFARIVERARTDRSPPRPGGAVPGEEWRAAKRAMATPTPGARFEAFGLLHVPREDEALFADAVASSPEGLAPSEFAADPRALAGRMRAHARLLGLLRTGGFMLERP